MGDGRSWERSAGTQGGFVGRHLTEEGTWRGGDGSRPRVLSQLRS